MRISNEKNKIRREGHKKVVLNAHNARVEKLRADVGRAVQKHDDNVRAIRRPGVERLLELAQEKRDIESKIMKCQAELEQAYFSAARQLQVALDGRVEEMMD